MNSTRHFLAGIKARALPGLFFFLAFFVTPGSAPFVLSEERRYVYNSIDYLFEVNRDTTVNVTETQTYRFSGEYHQGWRNIPKNKIDDLEVQGVTDVTEGKPLVYSSRRLEKTDPASWGKYTTFYENGEYIIEWYYDARDTTRTWTLEYALYGAIAFHDQHDELYWNLFTEYSAPVERVSVTVLLPEPRAPEELRETFYISSGGVRSSSHSHSEQGFLFTASGAEPQADLTIVAGWPKGVVDEGAYWRYWWSRSWGYVGSAIVLLLLPFLLWGRWYYTERYRTGRGVVVPQYEPPLNLPPAMAEVITRERISEKAWAATIIDLAVRGHLSIIQDSSARTSWRSWLFVFVAVVIFLPGSFFLLDALFPDQRLRTELSLFLILVSCALTLLWLNVPKFSQKIRKLKNFEDYILKKTSKNTDSLQDYEKKFLKILFGTKEEFSTFFQRENQKSARALHEKLEDLKENLLCETVSDTKAYQQDFRKWETWKAILIGGVIVSGAAILVTADWIGSGPVFLIVLFYSLVTVYGFFRYNPRLNAKGEILREDWLGFKLYLETAEKHRLRNLTPQTFERYLPYAMIFGIEKKWARVFESIVTSPPNWYHGSVNSSSGTPADFSTSAFSSSFASSFTRAFASSGGSGASGGGGSAGGGGGGGGGGAS